jgi:hypothetical protein
LATWLISRRHSASVTSPVSFGQTCIGSTATALRSPGRSSPASCQGGPALPATPGSPAFGVGILESRGEPGQMLVVWQSFLTHTVRRRGKKPLGESTAQPACAGDGGVACARSCGRGTVATVLTVLLHQKEGRRRRATPVRMTPGRSR